MSKGKRREAILSLIGKHQIATQEELVERLGRVGIHTTQATVSRDLEELGAIKVRAAGGHALGVAADVADRASVEAMAERVVRELGGIDILVNNAAIYPLRPWTEITEEEWDSVLAVNLKGSFFMAQACGRVMLEQGSGSIINVSSVGAIRPYGDIVPYAAAKG